MIAKEFMIFDCTELTSIDFTEVMETSIETVRKSIDETKTFVKWDSVEIPRSVENLKTKIGPYTYDEILEILQRPEWAKEIIN
jgi:aspartyl/asparaginyl-tRNA synthetase